MRTLRFGRIASGALLVKLAKHLALLVCLLIVGSATGRPTAHPVTIFVLVAAAACLHAVGICLAPKSRRSP